eukprot:TRINITY_DN14413_c0_g1_i1.p1 TRINITY_DN14413_c0_g1~~TRINITY_DN14413_c0_g1_i1.p1  ORF type:complete len:223 (+),score=60.33 TRINITY_DN14413_c0_g1_i1:224-892(+)
MGESNTDLLVDLIANKPTCQFTDTFLGFAKYGACTAHWIEAKTDRQLSHVDYPAHVGSGPFWEHNVERFKHFTTRYQVNKVLPFFSVQVLAASDKMDVSNGSTEVVPCSQMVGDIDVLIHDKEVYDSYEPYFHNVSLDQGDVLIFCRRLCHRGGKNLSDKRRNALISQCVWLFGTQQEEIDSEKVIEKLKESKRWAAMSSEEQEALALRIRPPYPTDTRKST